MTLSAFCAEKLFDEKRMSFGDSKDSSLILSKSYSDSFNLITQATRHFFFFLPSQGFGIVIFTTKTLIHHHGRL